MLMCNDASRAQRFCEFAAAADYSEAGFRRLPAFQQLPSRRAGNRPLLLEVTGEPTAFNVLSRLFLFGWRVPARAVHAAFPGDVLDFVLACGMAEVAGDEIVPRVMLAPCDPFLLAADPLFRMEPEPEPDVILWPNQTTRMLQHSSIRTPSRATLDLGSGCGVMSLLAAQYSGRVVATDLNPRTAEFVAFNAYLNGVSNVEWRIGDTYAPVAGQRFDRILANPPFFVMPSAGVMYCDNPMELDGFCRRVVREGAGVLEDGGFLQMVCEWVQVSGQPWQDRLAEWVDGTGCDAWVLRTYHVTAAEYAHQRTCDQYAELPNKATARFEQCTAYYRQRQVEEVHGGIFALRRRTGSNWVRMEEGRIEPNASFGHLVTEVFATEDVLAADPTDERLLGLRPMLAQEARLEQQFRAEAGRWAFTSLQLTLQNSLPASMGVESAVAEFLVQCDGRRTLAELTGDLAGKVNTPPEAVRQQCCAVVRKLASRRFLGFAAVAAAQR